MKFIRYTINYIQKQQTEGRITDRHSSINYSISTLYNDTEFSINQSSKVLRPYDTSKATSHLTPQCSRYTVTLK